MDSFLVTWLEGDGRGELIISCGVCYNNSVMIPNFNSVGLSTSKKYLM